MPGFSVIAAIPDALECFPLGFAVPGGWSSVGSTATWQGRGDNHSIILSVRVLK